MKTICLLTITIPATLTGVAAQTQHGYRQPTSLNGAYGSVSTGTAPAFSGSGAVRFG